MVISGGFYSHTVKSTTELLEISLPNPQWRIVDELELPVPMFGLKVVTLGSDFIIAGGLPDSGSHSNQILQMSCNEGQCRIQNMPSTLQVARSEHIFLPISASLANCD